jgi:hypothetical protein
MGGANHWEGTAEITMTTYKEENTDLQTALKEFASSPRFSFLKSIQVGPLLGDDAGTLGPLAEMTFEQLIAVADERSSDLCTLDDGQERLLVAVLHALAEGETAESVEPGFDASDESDETDSAGSTETTFNSVQCELELRERVAHLKAHPNLDRVADSTLGTFWNPESPRAPFEESLTIRQFLALDLGVLSKKRSMTSIRMRALAEALEEAAHRLEVLEERRSPSVHVVAPLHHEPISRRSGSETVARHKWQGHSGDRSPLEMVLVECVMNASSDGDRDAMNVFGALHHFCSVFTVPDFLLIMSGGQLSVPTQRKLTAWVNSGALREVVPSLRLALQGPGTHISRVAGVLQGHSAPAAIYAITATLIARGLGAHEVSVDGVVCPHVWSSNPGIVTLLARQVGIEKKQSPTSLIAGLCPDMDPFLHSWLQGVVSPQKTAKKRQRRRS